MTKSSFLLYLGMGVDETVAHISGNVSSYATLLKLAKSESSKMLEENISEEMCEIAEQVCFHEFLAFPCLVC